MSGWGTTSEGGKVSRILQKAEIPIVNSLACVDAYSAISYPVYPHKNICAGEMGRDSCQVSCWTLEKSKI